MKKSAGELIRNWWVDKGCVQHSDRLKAYADRLFQSRMNARDQEWGELVKKYCSLDVGESMIKYMRLTKEEKEKSRKDAAYYAGCD